MMASMTLTTTPLNRAATLHHLQTDRFKTARLSFITVRPADAVVSPLSTLLYGIMRRGSEGYPRLELLNRALDELYGTTLTIRNYLHGDHHVISFTADMVENAFIPAFDAGMDILGGTMHLLSELILHPLTTADGYLRAEAVEQEKQALCDSLRAIRNDTRAYAGDRFRRIMCPDEPYGLSIGGTVEDVMAVTPAQVTALWRAHLAEARCEVFYVGRSECSEVQRAWDKSFGHWDPAPAPHVAAKPHIPPTVLRRVEEDMPVAQGKLCMGWSCGETYGTLRDPAILAALSVCNELLGVMQSSLLFRHVREELSLCYECESALDLTKGILWVSCGIRSDRRPEAEEAIAACLHLMQEGRVDPTDVALAKLSLENSYRQIEDSQGAMESFWFRRLMNQTTATPEEHIAAIRAVTPEAVARAAAMFRPDTVYFLKGTAADAGEEEDGYGDL